jgi:hypothetical protein
MARSLSSHKDREGTVPSKVQRRHDRISEGVGAMAGPHRKSCRFAASRCARSRAGGRPEQCSREPQRAWAGGAAPGRWHKGERRRQYETRRQPPWDSAAACGWPSRARRCKEGIQPRPRAGSSSSYKERAPGMDAGSLVGTGPIVPARKGL